MTVKELITGLKKLPPDMLVFHVGSGEDDCPEASGHLSRMALKEAFSHKDGATDLSNLFEYYRVTKTHTSVHGDTEILLIS